MWKNTFERPKSQYSVQGNMERYLYPPLSATSHQNARARAINYTTCNSVPNMDHIKVQT